MLKQNIIAITSAVIIFLLMGSEAVPVHAAGSAQSNTNIPEYIRIGLFFAGTAAQKVNLSSNKGLILGYEQEAKFVTLIEINGNDTLTARKDDQYHIQLGGTFTKESANQFILAAKEKGIAAYLVFDGTWKVWTGQYNDSSTAQKELDSNIKGKMAGVSQAEEIIVISPAGKNIIVAGESGDIKFIYAIQNASLQFQPNPESYPPVISVNGIAYRGGVDISRPSNSDMTVVNVLKFEEYLYGVVSSEVGSSWQLEALKCQAVAARNFALRNIDKYSAYGFNLCNTTNSQVYKGYSREYPAAIQAVDETKGLRLVYNGKLAEIFYYSSNGGRTEDVKNVWGSDIPYLRSVPDEYENIDTSWTITLTKNDIKAAMDAASLSVGDITGLRVTGLAESGRVIKLLVSGTNREVELEKNNIRMVLGPNRVKSQWFSISTGSDVFAVGSGSPYPVNSQIQAMKVLGADGTKSISEIAGEIKVISSSEQISTLQPNITREGYTLTGRGWGHAVGMSQYGMLGMAKAGYKFDQILTHYFPGTKVE